MPNYLPEDFRGSKVANEITDVLSEYLTLKPKGKTILVYVPFIMKRRPLFP